MSISLNYLLIYSTTDGHTRTIMEAVAAQIAKDLPSATCTIANLKESMTCDVTTYSKVLIGASIRYGHFNSDVATFIQANYEHLNAMPSAFFGVNLTARKPNKRTPETNPYIRKFLAQSPWKPDLAAVFAGALWYPRYTTFDRCMIQFIMRITGGETDATKEIVYTDWEGVSAFATQFVKLPATVPTKDVEERRNRALILNKKASARSHAVLALTVLGGAAAALLVARRALRSRA